MKLMTKSTILEQVSCPYSELFCKDGELEQQRLLPLLY